MKNYSVSYNSNRGNFEVWYTVPLTGKRTKKTLYVTLGNGKKRPATTREEAEKAAGVFFLKKVADRKEELETLTDEQYIKIGKCVVSILAEFFSRW